MFLLAVSFFISTAMAATSSAPTFTVPALTGPVVDNGAMLSQGAQAKLSNFLHNLYDDTGTQIQILTVPDLGGLSIEEASIKVTDAWKLGSAKADNGILLMLARQERRVRIEVGQGYEGDLPDITANRIINDVILPRFKEGDIDRGVINGVRAIVSRVKPDYLQDKYQPRAKSNDLPAPLWMFIVIMVILFIISRLRPPGMMRRSRWGGFDDWGSGSSGGGWSGGGWGGGSSSGGSWSGGGGGFSGGGASGGW